MKVTLDTPPVPGWTEGAHPGATVRIIYMIRGDEMGDIRVQDYGVGAIERYRTGTFLPGSVTGSAGDTPKVEPEVSTWWMSAEAAELRLQHYVVDARAEGWEPRDVATGKAYVVDGPLHLNRATREALDQARTHYAPQVHTHVIIAGMFDGSPAGIVLHTGEHVWVGATYADKPGILADSPVRAVGDGRSAGFDQDGNCVLSVPVDRVKQYLTEEEAQQVAEAMCADRTAFGHDGTRNDVPWCEACQSYHGPLAECFAKLRWERVGRGNKHDEFADVTGGRWKGRFLAKRTNGRGGQWWLRHNGTTVSEPLATLDAAKELAAKLVGSNVANPPTPEQHGHARGALATGDRVYNTTHAVPVEGTLAEFTGSRAVVRFACALPSSPVVCIACDLINLRRWPVGGRP